MLIKRTEWKIAEKTVPYDIRTGKIKGKFVMARMLPQDEKIRLIESYNQHLQKNLKVKSCSLNEYLDTACICYKAAFSERTDALTPLKMYKKWADTRDGKMLSIKDWNSRKAFSGWYKSKKWSGAHPFEIVYNWMELGIHLYPPSRDSVQGYFLSTNYAYASSFVKMAKTLMKSNIPFTAHNFEEILNYLAGETYFTVNEYSDNFFFYIPSREHKRKYFRHIEWDELKIPRWK